MRGPQRVIVFCLLTTVVPTALLVTPLYLRFFWYAEVVYAVADSDVIVADEGISSFWCQNQSVHMNSTFSAYLVEGQIARADVRKTVAIKKHVVLPDDTLEWTGFYLLKGSRISFTICSRYEGGRILVVNGARNLKQCTLMEEGPLPPRGNPESEHKVSIRLQKERTKQNRGEKKQEEKKEIGTRIKVSEYNGGAEVKKDTSLYNREDIKLQGHGNMTRKIMKKNQDFKQDSHVKGNKDKREDYNEMGTWEKGRRMSGVTVTGIKEEIKQNDDVSNFKVNNSGGRKNDSFMNLAYVDNKKRGEFNSVDNVHTARTTYINQTSNRAGVKKKSKRSRRKERRNKRKKDSDDRKHERHDTLHRRHTAEHDSRENREQRIDPNSDQKFLRLRHENKRKTWRSKGNGNAEDLMQVNASNPVFSRSTNHGIRRKRQMENDTEDDFSKSVASSFEEDLFTCYRGSIILQEDYPPSPQCSNDYLQKTQDSSMKQTSHDITEDGYYYYIFYSDNEIVEENDIYVNFKLEKVVYEWQNASAKCLNETSCNFQLSFMSEEKVLLEIPIHDGINSDEEGTALLLHSACEPRMAVYMMFPLAVLLMILVSAFQ